MLKETLLDIWFGEGKNKNLVITNFKQIRKQNKKDYPDDPDANVKRQWGIRTNGAKKGNPKDSCLDWYLNLGHICINYTDFNYNSKYRRGF